MSLYNGPIRAGSRGGRGEFSWDNVKNDKDKDYFLGHSVKALTGRWQKNKDVYWYTRDKTKEETLQDEIRAIKEREEQAMMEALGLKPKTQPVVQAPMDAKELAVLLKKKAEQEEIDAGGASGAGAGAAGASGLSEADRIKGLGFQGVGGGPSRVLSGAPTALELGGTLAGEGVQEGSRPAGKTSMPPPPPRPPAKGSEPPGAKPGGGTVLLQLLASGARLNSDQIKELALYDKKAAKDAKRARKAAKREAKKVKKEAKKAKKGRKHDDRSRSRSPARDTHRHDSPHRGRAAPHSPSDTHHDTRGLYGSRPRDDGPRTREGRQGSPYDRHRDGAHRATSPHRQDSHRGEAHRDDRHRQRSPYRDDRQRERSPHRDEQGLGRGGRDDRVMRPTQQRDGDRYGDRGAGHTDRGRDRDGPGQGATRYDDRRRGNEDERSYRGEHTAHRDGGDRHGHGADTRRWHDSGPSAAREQQGRGAYDRDGRGRDTRRDERPGSPPRRGRHDSPSPPAAKRQRHDSRSPQRAPAGGGSAAQRRRHDSPDRKHRRSPSSDSRSSSDSGSSSGSSGSDADSPPRRRR